MIDRSIGIWVGLGWTEWTASSRPTTPLLQSSKITPLLYVCVNTGEAGGHRRGLGPGDVRLSVRVHIHIYIHIYTCMTGVYGDIYVYMCVCVRVFTHAYTCMTGVYGWVGGFDISSVDSSRTLHLHTYIYMFTHTGTAPSSRSRTAGACRTTSAGSTPAGWPSPRRAPRCVRFWV